MTRDDLIAFTDEIAAEFNAACGRNGYHALSRYRTIPSGE